MKAKTNVTIQDQDGNSTKPLLSSRLFKFRAFNKHSQEMYEVFSFCEKFIKIKIYGTIEKNKRSDFISLMQFTGLKDKNEVEIYEGDIVTYKRSVGNWTGQFMTTTHKIIFTEEVNAFVMEYGSSYIKLRKHWGYEYEVIGNIFENPELL